MTISASSRSTGQDLRYASNASAALPAITTLYPTDSRASAVAFRTNASSSTIRMVGGLGERVADHGFGDHVFVNHVFASHGFVNHVFVNHRIVLRPADQSPSLVVRAI